MSLDRIRKLFALAADQTGTPEGVAAARIARELMTRQSYDLAQLDPAAAEDADPFVRRRILLGGPAHWRCRLIAAVARHCECVAGYKPGLGRASLYGRRSTVEIAEYLYVVLSRALTRERVAWMMAEGSLIQEPERTRRANDFTQSAILALRSRMEELRRGQRDVRPQDYALVRSRAEGLDRWMEEAGFGLKKDPPFPFAYSEDGYRAGYRLPLVEALGGDG
ncbi:MAG: DUF2786 domain-containing protein [Alphaproteobacteria bacterium]|nr:DUF2786 domain-containing protein [Alphaproteobacteria bacterium]